MATRPVYVPDTDPRNPRLVQDHQVDFQWMAGRSAKSERKNISRLHTAASILKRNPLLDVSAGSDDPLGAQVCAGNLAVEDQRSFLVPLMAAYHGSRIFTGGGPYTDLYCMPETDIAADVRLIESGTPLGFRFLGLEWGARAEVLFYDWLVIHAIQRYRKLRRSLVRYKGFTEVSCLPGEEAPCHARACALYVALAGKKLLDEVLVSQDRFIEIMLRNPLSRPDEGGS